jgi:hypothetical protein
MSVKLTYMPRKQQKTVNRTVRLLEEVAEGLDRFADDQLISANAAVNKLIKERLAEYGYLEHQPPTPKANNKQQ